VRFPEVLETAIAELAPHRLTEYLYELSEVFNSFYRDCKVGPTCVLVCSRAGGPYALFAALVARRRINC
jgi:DALR anticodon binding domain